MMPKILVGAAISDVYSYCLDEFLSSLKKIDYPNYDILLIDNSKTPILYDKLLSQNLNVERIEYKESARDRMVESRNILRKYALDNKYDYLLSLDSDVIINEDTLKKLLFHKKDIISAVYFRELTNSQGQTKLLPLILEADKQNPDIIKPVEDIFRHRLIKIAMCGLGCILIHKKVLEKIQFRYDKGFDDDAFCLDARKHNFSIYSDTSILCKHLFLKRPWQWKNYEVTDKSQN